MVVIVIIVVILLLGWWLVQSRQSSQETQTPSVIVPQESIAPLESASPSATMSKTAVTISNSGYSPKDITIKPGESVTWTNSDSAVHTVNSAIHPTHQVYPPLNLGNLAPGTSKSLTFPEAGTYKYHDHLNPTLFGSVTVE